MFPLQPADDLPAPVLARMDCTLHTPLTETCSKYKSDHNTLLLKNHLWLLTTFNLFHVWCLFFSHSPSFLDLWGLWFMSSSSFGDFLSHYLFKYSFSLSPPPPHLWGLQLCTCQTVLHHLTDLGWGPRIWALGRFQGSACVPQPSRLLPELGDVSPCFAAWLPTFWGHWGVLLALPFHFLCFG